MLKDDGGRVRGFVPYPAPTDDERKRWRERREAERPDEIATAIRARDNWYAGGFDLTAAETRHLGEEYLTNLADHEPADLTTEGTPDLMTSFHHGAIWNEGRVPADLKAEIKAQTTTIKPKPRRKPKPTGVLTTVISDLDREIARLTEARERLTTIEGTE